MSAIAQCGRVMSCRDFGLSAFFCFQAEDGIRELVRSRGLGDVYKRQEQNRGINARELLLPIAHITTLTGSVTLIGTSSNLSLIHI